MATATTLGVEVFNIHPIQPQHPEPPAPRVRADLAVQLQGSHTVEAVCMARSVLLAMPAARIRITCPQPAYAAYTAWSDALSRAARVFQGDSSGGSSRVPAAGGVTAGHLHFAEEVITSVDCLTAEASPTRAPQIRVQLGGLLIIAADHAAVISQASAWTTAYGHAAGIWPELPPLASIAAANAEAPPLGVAA
ncbi:hypothetical protein [Streptacidiphilus sp. EB129]|uniref:hypothetical protein n=1 Tax=Streptacidiphilus sp. EB129 TaxID=3156262 RepID=UPI003512029C